MSRVLAYLLSDKTEYLISIDICLGAALNTHFIWLKFSTAVCFDFLYVYVSAEYLYFQPFCKNMVTHTSKLPLITQGKNPILFYIWLDFPLSLWRKFWRKKKNPNQKNPTGIFVSVYWISRSTWMDNLTLSFVLFCVFFNIYI